MQTPVLSKKLSKLGKLGRSILKRFMYSQMTVYSGLRIIFGKDQPHVQFTVEVDPPPRESWRCKCPPKSVASPSVER